MPSPSSKSLNSNTGTIRHRHKKSRPAPPPPVKQPEKKNVAEMFVGGTNSIRSQWRHQPISLITGCAKYFANVSQAVNKAFFYKLLLFTVYGVYDNYRLQRNWIQQEIHAKSAEEQRTSQWGSVSFHFVQRSQVC